MPRRNRDPKAITKRIVDGASRAASDWATNTEAAVDRAISGAIESADYHRQRTLEALNEGRYIKGLERVDKGAVKQKIHRGGGAVYATAVANSEQQIESALRDWLPIQERHLSQTVDVIPRNSLQDRKRRMDANFDAEIAAGEEYRDR